MYNFNVKEQTKNVVEWTRNWVNQSGNENTKVIIGISGGKDSTCVVAILCEAIGKDRVIGVMMPNGEQKDISDSIRVCEHFGIKNYTINIGNAYTELTDAVRVVSENGKEFPTSMYATNTPARLRMATLYGIGAMIGNCRVVNTGNISEDVCGYSTLYGDSAGDFSPLCKLTTEEVIAIGKELGAPIDLMDKIPSDGMCGKSDEDNLGFTYAEINTLIRTGKKGPHYDNIMSKYQWNKFKTDIIRLPHYEPNLPNFVLIL